jgi:hypothetical protein
MQNSKPGEPMKLPEIDMHGPVEVGITARFRMPGGEVGAMTIYAEPGLLPTRAQQLAIMSALQDPAQLVAAGAPLGVRPLTKPEFVEFFTKRATGQAIPMPGSQDYVPAGCEIPHGMLVHAIIGAGIPEPLAVEYSTRGLLEIASDQVGTLHWNEDLLRAMPDTMLLAMYQRITAPPAPEGGA